LFNLSYATLQNMSCWYNCCKKRPK